MFFYTMTNFSFVTLSIISSNILTNIFLKNNNFVILRYEVKVVLTGNFLLIPLPSVALEFCSDLYETVVHCFYAIFSPSLQMTQKLHTREISPSFFLL